MKRILALLIILVLVSFSATAVDTANIEEAIESIVDDTAPAVPFAAATIGNNWDDAYIGQFPHFGLGVSTGVVLIPSESIDDLFTLLSIERPADLESIDYIPIPAYTVEARLGGLIKPFDIGIKAGVYSQDAEQDSSTSSTDSILIDYAMAGFDIRYALVKQSLILPDISIGAGLNYYKTNIRTQLSGENFSIDNLPGAISVSLTDPDLGFTMESTSIDLKAQISKSLLILRPFGGVGASYGKTTVSADFYTSAVSGLSGPEIAALEAAGYSLDDSSIYYESEYTGWTTRAFAGVGLQVFMLKVNAQLSYSPETEAIGASVNGRIQF